MSAEINVRDARFCAVLAVCAALALVAAMVVTACSKPSQAVSEVADAVAVADAAAHMENASGGQTHHSGSSYVPTVSDMLSIPDSSDIVSVNLGGGASPSLPSADLARVRSAVAEIKSLGDCGFVFVDMDTGRGLAYNAGEEMYIASAAKAPFVCYLLEQGRLSASEEEAVRYAIVESDNESFESLYEAHMDSGYPDWMSSFGVNDNDFYGNYYPPMSARSLAAVWDEVLRFVQGGSEEGRWLGDMLSSTETSFIRDGLYGTGAEVMNKAGWIVEEGSVHSTDDYDSFDFMSVSDAGVIEAGGHTYIMVIVTTQPDGGDSEANVSALARALFDLRDNL